jgi:pilus assembly protein CpaD
MLTPAPMMDTTMARPTSPNARATSRLALRLGAVAVLALLASACSRYKHYADLTGSLPTDVRDRHPIVLQEAPRSIDIYGNGPQLDARQQDDLRAFAAEYRQHGRSHIIIETPSGSGRAAATLGQIRAQLSAAGVHGGNIQVRGYPAPDYTVAAPIRLSFAKLQARVPHACGHWPEDLGASNGAFTSSNRPYWNFGCAYQTGIAAQVADPLDLDRGRPEGRIDTQRRLNVIEKLRQGQDPTTQYRQQQSINRTVGN